ncbi:MAG: permease [Parcubacteria group bacterium]
MFKYIADLFIYRLLDLAEGEKLTAALHFFIYDSIKILVLILVVVSVVAFLRTYFPVEKIRRATAKAKFGTGNIVASTFGAVTPFCSCSSIPLFIGFLKARIPAGIAFSFLITSPLVNEIAFVMMGGLFGWRLAFLYALTGIALGAAAGIVLGWLKLDKEIILDEAKQGGSSQQLPQDFIGRAKYSWAEGKKTFWRLFPYVIGGVAVGAAIHGYVPQDFFMDFVGKYNVLAVPIAVLVGIPIYAGCSTVVPLIFSITANGVPLGTSLAFMMSIAGLSLPEGIILKKIMRGKLLAAFFGIVGMGIILIGYLFNIVS